MCPSYLKGPLRDAPTACFPVTNGMVHGMGLWLEFPLSHDSLAAVGGKGEESGPGRGWGGVDAQDASDYYYLPSSASAGLIAATSFHYQPMLLVLIVF